MTTDPNAIAGFRGERIRLVPLDRALHLENALRWLNDPDVATTLAVHLGVSRAQENEFFDKMERPPRDARSWAILDETSRHIGFAALTQVDWATRSALGGIVIGEKDAWGKGYATDVLRTRARIFFEELGMHRLEGHTINPAMRRVYEKAGYVAEGVARQKAFRGGRWHDAWVYAMLEEDWFGRR
jgi:RimJ/RimL family protein N-acetyltransferase